MGETLPICAGAQYRDVSTGENHGDVLRVKSVWVDEDMNTQLQVYRNLEDTPAIRPKHESVDLESFVEQIDESIIRVNSDHEAWVWRKE